MRHPWNEHDHPRDRRGRFGHGAGGNIGGASHPSGHGNGRGMPDIVSTADVSLSKGGDLSLDRHADGGLTVYNGHSSVTLDRSEAHDFNTALNSVGWGGADEYWVTRVESTPSGNAISNVALLRREDDDTVSLRLTPRPGATNDELRNAPAVQLKERDLGRIEDANMQLDSSFRVDTGNGDVDVFITDDHKFGIRHLGDDGRPVETLFDAKSFSKINQAINVVYEGFDESERFYKGAAADHVTRVDLKTNVGDVRVELFGTWRGTGAGDRLEIMGADDSWGIAIDGSKQEAWDDAVSEVENAGEGLNFYDRLMG
ncbi:hypothetical protein [Microbispora sp. CA-102843]|uniref:hypothetical protein n=1 Tax=Microbispora sp. CA-102843 TaxID=3239952 RepID=UPI003D8E2B8E